MLNRIRIYSAFWIVTIFYFIIPIIRSSIDCPPWVYYFDQFIPFMGWMIIPYYSYYIMFIIPPFIIKNHKRLSLLTSLLIKISLFCYFIFLVWPISSGFILRQVEDNGFSFLHSFITFDFLYQNAFPSMHVAVSVVIGYVLADEYPKKRLIFYLWAFGIFLGTFLIKQHYLLDSLSGLFVAILACYIYRKSFYPSTI